MTSPVLGELTAAGVSLWLDDLDRSRLSTAGGERSLRHLIEHRDIRGVTTNPTIFDRALGSGDPAYVDQLRDLGRTGMSIDDAITVVTTDDVRAACDILLPVWEASDGTDGRVSIEVDPRLAHDTEATTHQAQRLWTLVDRPNAMIKIPATDAGLPAITSTLAAGISVNVTLIFSVARYREVMAAHSAGLQQAAAAGVDLSSIASVASFFVSRVDTAIDAKLDARVDHTAGDLRGQAAIANARLAWAAYEDFTSRDEWGRLSAAGARPQRPLWASTGVKDPQYDPTRYVVELAAPGCVNTVPEATLHVVAEAGVYRGDTMTGRREEALEVMRRLADIGIEVDTVCAELEDAGVRSFVSSWEQLRTGVASILGG